MGEVRRTRTFQAIRFGPYFRSCRANWKLVFALYILADLEEEFFVAGFMGVLEGYVAASGLGTHRYAHPLVVQHGLIQVCALVTKTTGRYW